MTNASTKVLLEGEGEDGAVIMGRNMFGGSPGPWKSPRWDGWWGKNPPFHLPVFVLTHFERDPLVCEGGTTFYFVTGGPSTALRRARGVAQGKNIAIAGGAGTAKQFLENGAVDEILLHQVPVFLGRGVRLFDAPTLSGIRLEQVRVVEAPGVTHLTYRVQRKGSRRRAN